ncbi:MAG: isocitrate lyase/phosphoenolpyruvate mutase family protein [Solirubrobacteraceae bacterium]
MTQQEKAEAFVALHAGAPFVLPNPWDLGSAKVLEDLGYAALATTSAGLARALGREDGELALDQVVEHVHALSAFSRLPVAVDLENGFGPQPGDVATAITRIAEAGAVGASIEDFDPAGGIYPRNVAVERLVAAIEAARALDFPFTVTGRAENFIRGNPDLDDTIARLVAYEEAGADVLYAPGLQAEQVRAVRAATSRPLNVLAYPEATLAELADAGAQRVSLGSWLAHVATQALTRAATAIRSDGDFSALV